MKKKVEIIIYGFTQIEFLLLIIFQLKIKKLLLFLLFLFYINVFGIILLFVLLKILFQKLNLMINKNYYLLII